MTDPSTAPTDPAASVPAEAIASPRAARPRRVWDLVLTIVLLVLSIGGALVASIAGVFLLAFGSDSCGARTCDYDVMTTGMLVALVGPWVPVLLALIVAIVLLVLRRIAFWVPIVGGVLSVGALILGFVIAGSGVAPA